MTNEKEDSLSPSREPRESGVSGSKASLIGYGWNPLYEGRPTLSIPWIFGVIPPEERWSSCDDKGRWNLVGSDVLIGYRLRQEYERQIIAELIDPEWPSEYWKRIE